MMDGLLNGLLRLRNSSAEIAQRFFRVDRNHGLVDDRDFFARDLRDIGLLDGRVSPSTVKHVIRSGAWEVIEQQHRWL